MPANEYENQMVEILLSNLLTFRRICLVEKEYLETKIHPDIEMDFSTCLKKGYEPEIKLDLIDELNKFQKYKTSIPVTTIPNLVNHIDTNEIVEIISLLSLICKG